jgi:hypothetical protein
MAERRENSVLFSLKELRNIEDGRVKKEKDDADARVAADLASKEAAERAVRDAEDRKRRDEEDRVRRAEEEKEGRIREEQMRLQEAERRARVEGEVRLQEQRMHLELQAKRETKSPIKAILGVTGVLVIVAGGLGYKMYTDHQAELAVQRSKLADAEAAGAAAKAAQTELQARIDKIQKEMNDQLAAAKTDEERARIKADAAQKRAEAASNRPSHSHSAAKQPEPANADAVRNVAKKRTVSDNPLEGL